MTHHVFWRSNEFNRGVLHLGSFVWFAVWSADRIVHELLWNYTRQHSVYIYKIAAQCFFIKHLKYLKHSVELKTASCSVRLFICSHLSRQSYHHWLESTGCTSTFSGLGMRRRGWCRFCRTDTWRWCWRSPQEAAAMVKAERGKSREGETERK